jgi:hypothetical protein
MESPLGYLGLDAKYTAKDSKDRGAGDSVRADGRRREIYRSKRPHAAEEPAHWKARSRRSFMSGLKPRPTRPLQFVGDQNGGADRSPHACAKATTLD